MTIRTTAVWFSERVLILMFSIALLLGCYRIYGYYLHDIPYGYDPGFFRYAIESALASLPGLPPAPSPNLPYHEPLFGILASILTFIGFSVDTIIGPFLGFLSVFTAFWVYFLGKQSYNRSVWLVAATIFLLSIVQYQEYWWNYWRNIVGIIFILFSLVLLYRRSWLAAIPIAGIFTMHRPSALYFAVVVVFYLLLESIQQKRIPWRKILIVLYGGIVALPLYMNQFDSLIGMVEPIATTIGGATSSGTFFTTREFFVFILPYFLLIIPAIFYKMEKGEFDIVFIWFLVGLAWSVLRLFFYNRMLVFFDIFAILLAAYSLIHVIGAWWYRVFFSIFLVFFGIQAYIYTSYAYENSGRHTIKQEEFDIIRNLDILVPDWATVLSTYRWYTPWLLGYSKQNVLAPGLLDHQIWDEDQWNKFYFHADDTERCQMIQEYQSIAPQLYVFVWDNQPELRLPPSCFRTVLSNTNHPIIYEVLYQK